MTSPFSGLKRDGSRKPRLPQGAPVVDEASEERAVRRGEQLGFVARNPEPVAAEVSRVRRKPISNGPQKNVFIKGPASVLNWFIEYSNEAGHRAYWETLDEFRRLVEGRGSEKA